MVTIQEEVLYQIIKIVDKDLNIPDLVDYMIYLNGAGDYSSMGKVLDWVGLAIAWYPYIYPIACQTAIAPWKTGRCDWDRL